MHPLAEKVLQRDMRATARVCRRVDDRSSDYLQILKDLFPHTGKAWMVGVTGSPGAGKSTLTDRLIAVFREQQKRVAVIAVDPTSPFSGGAILGDRIRMQAHFDDPEVFIRSLATRGALGGLSRSTMDVARVLDAWGADVLLIETVGVGQDELEIARMAQTTLVVMAPGMGDDVQAIKAGILECADVFAVNKADREGADATVRDLELMIALGAEITHVGDHSRAHHGAILDIAQQRISHRTSVWVPEIERTVATRNQGIRALVERLDKHRQWLVGTEAGQFRQTARLRDGLKVQLQGALTDAAMALLQSEFDAAVMAVAQRQIDPYTAMEQLVDAFRSSPVASTQKAC